MQASFDLDRETAAHTLEWMELKFANQTFAWTCGGIAGLYTHKKLSPLLKARTLLFRKPWMKPVLPAFAVYCGYIGARELRGRRFAGSNASFEKMSGANDVLSRFREHQHTSDTEFKDHILRYLSTCAPTSKDELREQMFILSKEENAKYRDKKVRRLGKDEDDLYWMIGKIHGLENIAFCDEEDIRRVVGNPVALQQLINRTPHFRTYKSFDGLVANQVDALNKYKDIINKMDLAKSDRSKLLSLPFFCNKRVQGPAPQKGQWQYDLFTEIAGGKNWEYYDDLEMDPEHKITIHEYEKHLSPGLLEAVDTESAEFKRGIKKETLLRKTNYERHNRLKEDFRKFMNILAPLTEDEGKSLVHLIRNKHNDNYLEEIHGGDLEKELAAIAEKESYLKRNQYHLEKTKLDWADKSRMPIEKAKIKDLFKHSNSFKEKFHSEIGVYDTLPRTMDFSNRVIQCFYDSAFGSMLKLRNEIGLDDRFMTSFLRVRDQQEVKNYQKEDPIMDHGWHYFLNALFIPLDVMDYEDHYVGPGEDTMGDLYDVEEKLHLFQDFDLYERDPSLQVVEMDDARPPNYFRSNSHEENAPALGGDDDDDDFDEDEGDEEDEGESLPSPSYENPLYSEEDFEEPEWPYKNRDLPDRSFNEYFDEGENIRERFNDVEIDSFMKFLDVQPFRNWKDTSKYHARLGEHAPEDFSQKVDPEYHMAGEVEREYFEEVIFKQHRSGTTVRFVTDNQKPKFDDSSRF